MPMDEATKQALEDSIKHWEEIVACPKADVGSLSLGWRACALCIKFNKEDIDFDKECRGCPVMQATGFRYCDRSPYKLAYRAYRALLAAQGSWGFWQTAAKAELDFLKSLREPETEIA